MSSTRRTSGEIHLLAMLDGHAGGRLARRLPAWPAWFWYGSAVVLVCVLLAVLAWLVRTPARPAAAAIDTADVATSAHGNAEPAPAAITAAPARTATVIDVAAEPPSATATITPAPASTTPAHLAAASNGTGPATSTHAATPSSPLAAVISRFTHHGVTPANVRTPTTPRAAPNSATALAHGDTPPARTKRQPGTAKAAAAPPVDTDVALISAIIQHANARGDAAESDAAPACSDRPCGPRMPNQQ